ncbi:hypothetical protein F5050DRAFT_1856715 [Lentinula boryana]|uniref:Uncharacterized protein n=1 Tax=Lentinula boryana TaxID=40481 RepID=A0ABQ8Q1D0_9AGAR|nr:hypothetical protein F5050DRAFT_1856715 [Lentinula boryana]
MTLTQACQNFLHWHSKNLPNEEKADNDSLSNQSPWRLPYSSESHKDMNTFIYSFTWSSSLPPPETTHYIMPSLLHLEVCIVSILILGEYIASGSIAFLIWRTFSQGHLLELKLAAITCLEYSDFFALFGRGYHPHFQYLLENKLRRCLSLSAYEFWKLNAASFSSTSFYDYGYSGRALRLGRFLFKLAGVREDVQRLCRCDSLESQVNIWQSNLRSVWLNPLVVALLRNAAFCWNALGVPLNQRKMLLDEGGVYQYVCDTLDPVLSTYLLKTQNYFYLLTLLGHYTPECCPSYLTRQGFEKLKAENCERLKAFRLHTDSILNTLRGLSPASLTRALVMDHMDWYDPGSSEANDEVVELSRVLTLGGLVFWRSASRQPWYNEVFARNGFCVEPISVRQPGMIVALDRVNMYASFWKAQKVT